MTTLFWGGFFVCFIVLTSDFLPFWKPFFVTLLYTLVAFNFISGVPVCEMLLTLSPSLSLCHKLKTDKYWPASLMIDWLEFLASFVHFQNPNQKPVILRKRRQRIKIEVNWELFYYRCACFFQPFSHISQAEKLFFSARHHNLLLFLFKIPARPCTVQPHLEPEDEGGAAGRSGGRDARLRCRPWARQCQRHLLEPPGVWGLCSVGLYVWICMWDEYIT